MERISKVTCKSLVLLLMLFSSTSYGLDVIKLQIQQLAVNKGAHNAAVLKRALEVTEDEFGPFKLELVNLSMSAGRVLNTLKQGSIINTAVVPARELWDKHTITVAVPVRLGLLSYRLLLVNKADLNSFDDVNSLEQLKALTAGLHSDWLTTKIFNAQGFNSVESSNLNGLFSMLIRQRFNYIPRGIYEIYDELASREALLANIMVEPNIVLYLPTSSYVNVSPNHPRIAKRLKAGLNRLLKSGELNTLVKQYFSKDIKRANIAKRRIIKIPSPNFYQEDEQYFINLTER